MLNIGQMVSAVAAAMVMLGALFVLVRSPLSQKRAHMSLLSALVGLLMALSILLWLAHGQSFLGRAVFIPDFLGDWFFPRRFVLGWAFDVDRSILLVQMMGVVLVGFSLVFENNKEGLSGASTFGYALQLIGFASFILSATYWTSVLSYSLMNLGSVFTPKLETEKGVARNVLALLFFLVAGWVWTLSGARLVFFEAMPWTPVPSQWLAFVLMTLGAAISFRLFPIVRLETQSLAVKDKGSAYLFSELLPVGAVYLLLSRVMSSVTLVWLSEAVIGTLLFLSVLSLLHIFRNSESSQRIELGTGAFIALGFIGLLAPQSTWMVQRMELSTPALFLLYLLSIQPKQEDRIKVSSGAFTFFLVICVALMTGLPFLESAQLWSELFQGAETTVEKGLFGVIAAVFGGFTLSFLRQLTVQSKGAFLSNISIVRSLVLLALSFGVLRLSFDSLQALSWLLIPWCVGAVLQFLMIRFFPLLKKERHYSVQSLLDGVRWISAYVAAGLFWLDNAREMSAKVVSKGLVQGVGRIGLGTQGVDDITQKAFRGMGKGVRFASEWSMYRLQNGDMQRYLVLSVFSVVFLLVLVLLRA